MIKGIILIINLINVVIGAIVYKFWLLTIFILSLLKITNIIVIPWFAGIGTISAIGTGLWMLGIGIVLMMLGGLSTFIMFIISDR